MAIRSLIDQAQVDRALSSHNCQANSRHRIAKGDIRLKVKTGRSWEHYCVECARKIIERDMAKLSLLQKLSPPDESNEVS